MLYLVATPIGNLEDVSLRAIRTLQEADIVACEDTRHARVLFERHGIRPRRLVSYHSHNERSRAAELAEDLRTGASVAVVTDAGTPGISDPAWAIVKEAIQMGIEVVPIPGACAAIAALSASGMDTTRFVFEGFLPLKKGRRKRIEHIASEDRTVVIYESPHRIKRLLDELSVACGPGRQVAVARELTKHFEEFIRGTIEEVLAQISERFPESVKGECVVVLQARPNDRIRAIYAEEEDTEDEIENPAVVVEDDEVL
ncbi:MAG TPA: 16S rRNA (cytidine(1402)-2'-O)-methyltransferase [Candidatus Kapabacteria bacterium]|jgi:16S rRNA (cytidine1402-2'-O)-methyltransferase|nr:16S rRNA (cytidine(1402)-2'-O)-methyltransferase [Candidatus Kapabacteria bacterium]